MAPPSHQPVLPQSHASTSIGFVANLERTMINILSHQIISLGVRTDWRRYPSTAGEFMTGACIQSGDSPPHGGSMRRTSKRSETSESCRETYSLYDGRLQTPLASLSTAGICLGEGLAMLQAEINFLPDQEKRENSMLTTLGPFLDVRVQVCNTDQIIHTQIHASTVPFISISHVLGMPVRLSKFSRCPGSKTFITPEETALSIRMWIHVEPQEGNVKETSMHTSLQNDDTFVAVGNPLPRCSYFGHWHWHWH